MIPDLPASVGVRSAQLGDGNDCPGRKNNRKEVPIHIGWFRPSAPTAPGREHFQAILTPCSEYTTGACSSQSPFTPFHPVDAGCQFNGVITAYCPAALTAG